MFNHPSASGRIQRTAYVPGDFQIRCDMRDLVAQDRLRSRAVGGGPLIVNDIMLGRRLSAAIARIHKRRNLVGSSPAPVRA